MKCTSCGCENIAGADVCDDCGADLTYLTPSAHSTLERSVMVKPLRSLKMEPPPTVGLNTTIREVVLLLVEKGHGAALVVHENALLGIFSERDLLMKIGERYAELCDRPVREFMTPHPETLGPDDPIAFALNRMDVGHFRHIPIVENGEPKGLISVRNILRPLAERYLTPSA
jgi:CBS domain-containing protein